MSLVPVEVSVPILAYSSPPIRRMWGTVASVSTLLMSVGPAYRPSIAGNGRLEPRVAALALQRVQQAGLLAADVGAGAAMEHQRHREVRAEDPLAHEAGVGGLGDRRLQDVGLELVLAADVDERLVDLTRIGGDGDALDEHVRALLHQLAVLERPRLGLVGVADQVLDHVAVGQEGDLAPHLESGAAAAADARVHDLGQDVLGGHAQRLAQHLVAAAALVHLKRVQSRLVDAVEEDRLHVSLWSWGGNSSGALGPGRSAVSSASVRPAVSARWG